jgi:tetratricopeptide (TPR) repeat protein
MLPRRGHFFAAESAKKHSLLVASGIAHTQRISAENRLVKGRHLASTVLALDEATSDVHGSSSARYRLVRSSKDYLEGLLNDTQSDRRLALDVGRAYSLLARAQGLSVAAPVGQVAKAEDSLRQAATLVDPLLTSDPNNRDALLAAARINHDHMLAAETSHRRDEVLTQASKAVERLDTLLRLGGLSAAQLEIVSEYFYQIAVTHKNLHRFEEGIQYTRRCIEISRSLSDGALRVGLGLSLQADLYRVTGDLDKALETITGACSQLERAIFPNDTVRRSSWITMLWREGKILGATHGLGLNRTGDAIRVLQEAFDLIEEWTRNDVHGALSRLYFASIGRELGELLRVRQPERALAIYDHSLLRLSTVVDNTEARRGEAVMLAGSAYALRRLGRTGEAERRLDAAYRVLAQTGGSATPLTSRNTTLETLLRARWDHFADLGQPRRAVEIYEELLARIEAAKLDPRHDLRDAVAVSAASTSLAALYGHASMPERATALWSRHVALWREWESRLPKSFVVQRQLQLVRAR